MAKIAAVVRAQTPVVVLWLLFASAGAIVVSANLPNAPIVAASTLALIAGLWLRARRRDAAPVEATTGPSPSDRDRLLVAIGESPHDIAIIRFNEYRALACMDHGRAESAMQALLDRLKHGVGQRGAFARIEPDIFGVQIEGGADALEAIRYMLCQPLAVCGETVRPTATVGTASPGPCAETALARAIADIGPSPHFQWSSGTDDFALEQELAKAISSGALTLHYQPIFDIAAGRVTGAEALLRWDSETQGPVSPALFVPILERSRLIHDAGLWALSTACRDAANWAKAGLDLTVAVNVSARQIQDRRLVDAVSCSLSRNGLDADRLELELTETAAMADMTSTQALFSELRSKGVRLSIDDFGAGFSNLNYLRSLTFDKLKIDRQFVMDVDTRNDSQAICRAIVALADGLGIALLAEGVEREEEIDMLRNLGCKLFQGYYFGRPMPSAEFTAFAEDRERHQQLSSPVHRQLANLTKRLAS